MQITSIKQSEGQPLKAHIIIEHLELLALVAAAESMMQSELPDMIANPEKYKKMNSFIRIGRLCLANFCQATRDLQDELQFEPSMEEVAELHERINNFAKKNIIETLAKLGAGLPRSRQPEQNQQDD